MPGDVGVVDAGLSGWVGGVVAGVVVTGAGGVVVAGGVDWSA